MELGGTRVIVNGEDAALARVVARGCWSEIEYFSGAELASPEGVLTPAWRIALDGKVTHGSAPQGVVRWPADAPQLGRHNRLNALAALAAARHAGVPIDVGLSALQEFRGVRRRLELRGAVRGITVYDDFAHHPTAIATTIDGLRRTGERGRILAVLEPRSQTMKRGVLKGALSSSLAGADRVFCYAANLGWDAAAALAPLGPKAAVHDDLDALVDAVADEARSGDRVLVMSNGGFGGIHEKLLDALAG